MENDVNISDSKMDADIDRQIESIKKLIPAASGVRLTFLTRRLNALLQKKQELLNEPVDLNLEDEQVLTEVQHEPSLSIKENPVVKVVSISQY
jgi:hypothetical protein